MLMSLFKIILIGFASILSFALIGLIMIGLEDPDEDGYGEHKH